MSQGTVETQSENVEALVQREQMPQVIKVTLLPNKARDEEATLLLTRRYGNEENLKGFESVAGFLPGLMLRPTKKFNLPTVQG